MDQRQLRDFMGSLPGAQEYEHGGLPAFRIPGRRRFASMLGVASVHLMPGDEGIRAAVAQWPDSCRERWFAGRLSSVEVSYPGMDDEDLIELVTDSWRSTASLKLVREFERSLPDQS